jgi:N-acetylneuraminic acid mutarotase
MEENGLTLKMSMLFFLFLLLPSLIFNVASATTESYWSNGAPMPTARSEVTSAVLDGKIYVVGGFENGHSTTSVVEVYDPVANEWTTVAPLPQPLDHTAAAAFDGKLYVVGGGYLDRDSLSDRLFIYNPTSDNWTEGANLPNARGAMTANFINGVLYVVGGVDSQKTLSSILAHNISSNTWSEKAPMPTTEREHLTSAVVDGKLYVMGGRTNGMSANVDTNEVYDPKTDRWTVLEPMPSKRGGLASAFVNGSIYVFGGEQPSGTFSNNEKYDPANNKWTVEAPMPTARHGLAAASIGDRIFVIGGGPHPGGSAVGLNEIFHVGNGR